MSLNFKALLKDVLPSRLQVPVKYWSDQARGFAEPEMVLLKYLVRKGGRVVDVGGNRGVYAYHCWKLGAAVDVFEPNPVCLGVLEPWARGRQRVTLHPVALSDHAGTAELHIPIDDHGVEHDASASIEHAAPGHVRDQVVPLRTLDSFEFEDVSLIKIDVEGHEFSVLEGAGSTISTSRPALLVEIEQRHCVRPIGEVFQTIIGHGYQGFFMTADGLLSLDQFNVTRHQSAERFGGAKWQYINNFLFLHQGRVSDGDYAALLDTRLAK